MLTESAHGTKSLIIVRPSTTPDGVLSTAVARSFDVALGAMEPRVPALLHLEGPSCDRYRLFANALIRDIPDPRYLEVGVGAGSAFCAAVADNGVRSVAIDNWSGPGDTRKRLLGNLASIPTAGADIRLIEGDFREIDIARQGRFNVYLFDVRATPAGDLDGLTAALPALDPAFVLIVGGWNQAELREDVRRTIKRLHLTIVYAIEIRTTTDERQAPDCSGDPKAADWLDGAFIAVLQKPRATLSIAQRTAAPFVSRWRRLATALGGFQARAKAQRYASHPGTTEVLVLITHHYAADRLHWLDEVVRNLAGLGARRTHAIIVTNTSDASELTDIRSTALRHCTAIVSAEVVTAPPLQHPHDLPWAQKPLVLQRFLGGESSFTHLISLEDDMALGAEGFRYWLKYRPRLAAHGLIPSFMRTEMRSGDPIIYATDATVANSLRSRGSVRVGGISFVALDNPYCAVFILDRALAREYVASGAFHMGASMSMSPWWTRERAAMGLCWTNPPSGFAVRYVVPVDAATLSVASCSCVQHLPGNYANDPVTPYGKLAIDAVFVK
jgi:hypothetical protein